METPQMRGFFVETIMGGKDRAPVRAGFTEQQAREKSRGLPFSRADIQAIMKVHPTPFYLYDGPGIVNTATQLNNAFSWVEGGGFKNFYAVKAFPNKENLKTLKKLRMGADCSSLFELEIAEMAELRGEEIMFTSNDTPAEEFIKAKELGAIVNFDDISHISYWEKHVGPDFPEVVSCRFNPGKTHPEDQKFGMTKQQVIDAYKILKGKGIRRFGLHTMIASNELDPQYHIETARMMFGLARDLKEDHGIDLEFVNLGGGLGIPYEPGQKPIDINAVSQGIREEYEREIVANKLAPLRITMESGRYVTGPHGYLVTTVRHLMEKYKDFAGLDASMADLMRPGMYGAYHHATILGKEEEPYDVEINLTGSLCEGNDFFAKGRKLPALDVDDIVVFHDAGAHGHAMGFNYNGKTRPAQFLKDGAGTVRMIERAQTTVDLHRTQLDFQPFIIQL
jgi:diaminopimelate decarboxylase